MQNKYKVTSFTRLLIFMIFFAPVAYMGAHYYQGDNGWEKLKSLVGIESQMTTDQILVKKRKEVQKLELKLTQLKAEIEQLTAE